MVQRRSRLLHREVFAKAARFPLTFSSFVWSFSRRFLINFVHKQKSALSALDNIMNIHLIFFVRMMCSFFAKLINLLVKIFSRPLILLQVSPVSKQTPTVTFSRNTPHVQEHCLYILGMNLMTEGGTYLGCPIFCSRSKYASFNFIKKSY